jgi:hypothetical protein
MEIKVWHLDPTKGISKNFWKPKVVDHIEITKSNTEKLLENEEYIPRNLNRRRWIHRRRGLLRRWRFFT